MFLAIALGLLWILTTLLVVFAPRLGISGETRLLLAHGTLFSLIIGVPLLGFFWGGLVGALMATVVVGLPALVANLFSREV